MIDKDFVAYQSWNSREYYPLVKRTTISLNTLINQEFFNDSASQFASFFTNETNLSAKELEELRKIVDSFKKKNDRLYNQINRIHLSCYHLLIRKEKMHQFNGSFSCLVYYFSLLIPFFTIEIIREISNYSKHISVYRNTHYCQ
jgi:hypothetical protein